MKSKVLIAHDYGSGDVLQIAETEMRPLKPGFARIAVKAAGVNPVDARRMSGEVRFGPLPNRFGTEFAGVIVELPDDETDWQAGDEVLGSGAAPSTHATVTDVPIGNLVRRPAGLDWAVTGSMAGTVQTAMAIMESLGSIRSLLVHGGGGGCGSALVQLAVEAGIRVVATASRDNQAYLRGLGALPTTYGDGLVERVRALHPDDFDAAAILGGTEAATLASLKTVKPDGAIVSITKVPAPSDRVVEVNIRRSPENLAYFVERVADGRFSWEVSQSYPFEQAAEAFNETLKGHARGKRVLVF